MFKSEHIFVYPVGVDPVDPVLIGHRRDGEYVVHGQPTYGVYGWMTGLDSKTYREHESPIIDVALSSQSLVHRGKRYSLKTVMVLGIQYSIQGSMQEATYSNARKRFS